MTHDGTCPQSQLLTFSCAASMTSDRLNASLSFRTSKTTALRRRGEQRFKVTAAHQRKARAVEDLSHLKGSEAACPVALSRYTRRMETSRSVPIRASCKGRSARWASSLISPPTPEAAPTPASENSHCRTLAMVHTLCFAKRARTDVARACLCPEVKGSEPPGRDRCSSDSCFGSDDVEASGNAAADGVPPASPPPETEGMKARR